MTAEKLKEKKCEKSKSLNIIYFIDSKKTHSFKISMRNLNIILAIFFIICLWSALSSFLLYDSFVKNSILNQRILASAEIIFDYQNRFDGVFEIAYEKDNNINEDKSANDLNEENEYFSKNPKKIAENNIVETNPNNKTFDGLYKYQESLTIKSNNELKNVVIEKPRLYRSKDKIKLNFSIRNTKSPIRQEGIIWAELSLIDNKGKLTKLKSPKEISIKRKKNQIDFVEKANNYSIRFYITKEFIFSLPAKWNGWITMINIGMIDKSGKVTIYEISNPEKKIDMLKMAKVSTSNTRRTLDNSSKGKN